MYKPKNREKPEKRNVLRRANDFLGERLGIACDTIIDVSNAVAESVGPIEKHRPGLIPKFVGGQKELFGKRRTARDHLLSWR
jgi:hypothetical protein